MSGVKVHIEGKKSGEGKVGPTRPNRRIMMADPKGQSVLDSEHNVEDHDEERKEVPSAEGQVDKT